MPTAPVSDFQVDCPAFGEPVDAVQDDALEAVTLECLGSEGEPVTMNGKPPMPTIVNFWATWCGPCVDEMPLLDEFALAAQGEVGVLGVATNNPRGQATSFAVDMDLSFPSVLDLNSQVITAEGIVGMPVTIFLDEDGAVVHRHIGAYDSMDKIKADVAEHLGVTL